MFKLSGAKGLTKFLNFLWVVNTYYGIELFVHDH